MKNFFINEVGNNMLDIYNNWIYGCDVKQACINLKEMVTILLNDLHTGVLHGSDDDIETLKNMLIALDFMENAPADENICINDVSGFITDMLDRMSSIREDVAQKFLDDLNKALLESEESPYNFIVKVIAERLKTPLNK